MRIRLDTYGPVARYALPYAQKKIARLDRIGESMEVDVRLVQLVAPAISRPAVAHANLTWRGQFIEAHATGQTMFGAIDLLHDRLRRQLVRVAHRAEERRRPSRIRVGGP